MTNGYTSLGEGGGIESGGTVTLLNCVVSGNAAPGGVGGGIDYWPGTATLIDCTLSGNTAAFGGGVYCYDSPLTLSNCLVSGNSASEGGGIDSGAATLALNNCVFNDNSALNVGGGLEGGQLEGGTLEATNCTFTANSAGEGGAMDGINGTLDQCTISNNIAQYGAGIMNEYGAVTLNNCMLAANAATNGADGAIGNGGDLTANNCTFIDNTSTNGGAVYGYSAYAIYNEYATNFLVNCTVYRNDASAGTGGGLCNDSSSTMMLTNTIVAGNFATNDADIYGVYSGVANFIGGNPQLASEGDYGGTTPTMPPMFGSPVIDAGTDWVTNFLATDARGFPRQSGAHVDIGAVEAQIAPANNRPVLRNPAAYFPGRFLENGMFQFSFTNVANADFTVLTSTNLALPLAQWTVAGNASQSFVEAGQFYFSGVVPTWFYFNGTNETVVYAPQQFYRVVSP